MTYRLRAATRVVVVATTFLGDAAVGAAPTALPLPTWGTVGGGVDAIALSGTTAYIGGDFTYVGPSAGGFVAFDVSSGALDPTWPQLTGDGAVLAPDGAGGWYIAGSFTAVGGLVRQGLAHLRADGTVDPGWAPSVSGGAGVTYVGALAVAGSTVYVGGQFQAANGVVRNNLAAFDASGAVTSFDPEPNGPVRAMWHGPGRRGRRLRRRAGRPDLRLDRLPARRAPIAGRHGERAGRRPEEALRPAQAGDDAGPAHGVAVLAGQASSHAQGVSAVAHRAGSVPQDPPLAPGALGSTTARQRAALRGHGRP